jgi:hypothetical protein
MVYVLMFSERTEYEYEIYKECRASNYVFSDVNFLIKNKLFKCLIYNKQDETLYYYKTKLYPKALDTVEFIENDLAKIVKLR